jgi:hypothetical protein
MFLAHMELKLKPSAITAGLTLHPLKRRLFVRQKRSRLTRLPSFQKVMELRRPQRLAVNVLLPMFCVKKVLQKNASQTFAEEVDVKRHQELLVRKREANAAAKDAEADRIRKQLEAQQASIAQMEADGLTGTPEHTKALNAFKAANVSKKRPESPSFWMKLKPCARHSRLSRLARSQPR